MSTPGKLFSPIRVVESKSELPRSWFIAQGLVHGSFTVWVITPTTRTEHKVSLVRSHITSYTTRLLDPATNTDPGVGQDVHIYTGETS
jgi:hypothetical protein